jgi:excisionase family DNA binding protein
MMDDRRTSDDRRAATRDTPDRRVEPDVFFTVDELSRRWKCNRRYVYKLIEARLLLATILGPRLYRIRHEERDRYELINHLSTSG